MRFTMDGRKRQPPTDPRNLPNGKLLLDHPAVTRDEALELMAHHLQLAAMYYEATPEDESANRIEVMRILSSDVKGHEPPGKIAANAWLQAMDQVYGEYRADDPDEEEGQ